MEKTAVEYTVQGTLKVYFYFEFWQMMLEKFTKNILHNNIIIYNDWKTLLVDDDLRDPMRAYCCSVVFKAHNI